MAYGGGPPSVTISAGTKLAWKLKIVSRNSSRSSVGAITGSEIRRNH